MARPIFSHELGDTDFQWLLNNFTENNPHATVVDQSCLPIVIVLNERAVDSAGLKALAPPLALPSSEGSPDETDPANEKP